uniref:Fucosyltransferase n=1 Tax=Timema genevievae TaxID=629358 RepID=A0A7R9K811_TIMGE|nr:unnamed protein product [Timema genevievae]
MKYIPVDSYGACLQNKKLPENLLYPSDGTDSDEFLHFISRYKFALAFENAVCEDYISEKLWRPLAVGSVPIYMGSPSVKDWLPNPDSAILISEFESPEKLAHFLKELNNDTPRYESYLGHKLDSATLKITNKKLLSALSSRSKENIDWGVNVEQFECYICHRVHIRMKGRVKGYDMVLDGSTLVTSHKGYGHACNQVTWNVYCYYQPRLQPGRHVL